MNYIPYIMERRSIRKFQDKPVEKEKLEAILRAAMQAPTAKDGRPWQFLVVQSREAMEAVAQMSPYAMCAKNAAALIITLVETGVDRFDQGLWIQDLGAANQNILTQIEAEGLGGTWLGMYPFPERISALVEYFHLPETVLPFSAIALGYKAKEKPADLRYNPAKVHWEQYGQEEIL